MRDMYLGKIHIYPKSENMLVIWATIPCITHVCSIQRVVFLHLP